MVNGEPHSGYLALPPGGRGPGLLLLHAWWGLTELFKHMADELAAAGFVVFAPDFFDGVQTDQIAVAEQQVQGAEGDFAAMQALASAALAHLQAHSARIEGKLAALGFSFGAAYALVLDEAHPEAFDKVVLYYGMAGAEVGHSQARYLAHFAENDPYESTEAARGMQAPNLTVHMYPDTGHWFAEANRPDAYAPSAAELAWQRTLAFLQG
ncbi:MAG: dienelactone hydrolase family protein [Anaerolineales bacterium]|nr:dienelactone hydrolase family protein [Anaerolineales bacterium]MCW5887277.1 dienelactone hydrolase family protein [Anaerolineales bacterium]